MQKRVLKENGKFDFKSPLTKVDLTGLADRKKKKKESFDLSKFLKQQMPKDKAYKVTFKGYPELLYISFTKDRVKAVYDGYKYFKDNFYPPFLTGKDTDFMRCGKAHRVPEFDKYCHDKRVPITELMKVVGLTFCCSCCGNDNFDLSDVEKGRCFLVEGEGDVNDFTKGLVLCYSCYKKYFG